MTATLFIPGKFPGLNEIIAAAKSGHGRYNAMKRKLTNYVAEYVVFSKVPVFKAIVRIELIWIEKEKRRDKDNVAAAKKFIFDGLAKSGVLGGDGWKYISGFSDDFALTGEQPVFTEPGVWISISDELPSQ